jgi:hypothetical protein
MCIGNQTTELIDHEIGDNATAGLFSLENVPELVDE